MQIEPNDQKLILVLTATVGVDIAVNQAPRQSDEPPRQAPAASNAGPTTVSPSWRIGWETGAESLNQPSTGETPEQYCDSMIAVYQQGKRDVGVLPHMADDKVPA